MFKHERHPTVISPIVNRIKRQKSPKQVEEQTNEGKDEKNALRKHLRDVHRHLALFCLYTNEILLITLRIEQKKSLIHFSVGFFLIMEVEVASGAIAISWSC
jgi:hypothetical protein